MTLFSNFAAMDISADLYELSRTPMTVVSAGIKSILDIGLTLEYLVCIHYKLLSSIKFINICKQS